MSAMAAKSLGPEHIGMVVAAAGENFNSGQRVSVIGQLVRLEFFEGSTFLVLGPESALLTLRITESDPLVLVSRRRRWTWT